MEINYVLFSGNWVGTCTRDFDYMLKFIGELCDGNSFSKDFVNNKDLWTILGFLEGTDNVKRIFTVYPEKRIITEINKNCDVIEEWNV